MNLDSENNTSNLTGKSPVEVNQPSRVMLTIIGFALIFMAGATFTLVPTTIDKIADFLNMRVDVVGGILFFIMPTGLVLASFLSGIISDVLSKKTVGIIGTLLFIMSTALFPWLPLLSISVFLLFLFGMARGISATIASTLLLALHSHKRSKISNYTYGFGCVGAFAGPMLVASLLRWGVDWRVIYIIFSCMAIILFIALCMTKIPKQVSTVEGKMRLKDIRNALTNKMVLFLLFGMILYVCYEAVITMWTKIFFIQELHSTETWATVALGMFWISMGIGRFIIGKMFSHIKELTQLIILSIAAFILMSIYLMTNEPVLAIILICVLGVVFAGSYPAIISYADRSLKKYRATALGLIIAGGGLGRNLNSVIVSFISHFFGLRWGLTGCLAVILASVVLFVSLLIRKRRKQENP